MKVIHDLLICLLQILGSLFLFALFLFCIFSVIPFDIASMHWRENLAMLVTLFCCLYISIRLGFYYGSLTRRLPTLWGLRLLGVLAAISSCWHFAAWGAFDLPFRWIALRSDYWNPANFPDDLDVRWPHMAFKFIIACLGLTLLKHLIFIKPSTPELR